MWNIAHVGAKIAILIFIVAVDNSRGQSCNDIAAETIQNSPECEDHNWYVNDNIADCSVASEYEDSYNMSVTGCNDTLCYLQSSNCTACVSGTYGRDCENRCVCASDCSYNRTVGCVPSGSQDKECNLLELNITSPSGGTVEGTEGINTTLIIGVMVSLSPSDVNVTVSGPGLSQMVLQDENGTYTFNFIVGGNEPGDYNFTAIALLDGNSTNIADNIIVTVTIYDPVSIVNLTANYQPGGETAIEGNTVTLEENRNVTQMACWANGFGKDGLQVVWLHGGGQIATVNTGQDIYQSTRRDGSTVISTLNFQNQEITGIYTCQASNTDGLFEYFDSRTVQLQKPGNSGGSYADNSDFIVAVSVLGAALFITIVAFTIALWQMHRRKEIKNMKSGNSNNVTSGQIHKFTELGRDNQAMAQTPHPPMSGDPDSQKRQNAYLSTPRPRSDDRRRAETDSQGNNLTRRQPEPTPQQPSRYQRPQRSDPHPPISHHPPALYDEVAADSKPPLPPDHPTLHQRGGDNDNVYLEPNSPGLEPIYQDTLT